MSSPRKASLLVIFLTVFIDLLGFGMVLPLLPVYAQDIAKQLKVDQEHGTVGLLIGALMSSFSLMQFLFAPLWGRLSDRIGRRPVLMVGLAGSVVFYTLFGLATTWKSLPLLFVARIGAGIAGATISTAQAYIADATTLENRAKGMALIGAAFGLGFTFGPLFGWLAVPSGKGDPGPGPGYAAAGLSAVALILAYVKLPESLPPGGRRTERKWLDMTSLVQSLRTPSIGPILLAMFVCIFAFANFESTLSLMLAADNGPYEFDFRDICLTFAYIGITLTVIQGGVVRRIAGRVSEGAMAAAGAVVEIVGFGMLAWAESSGTLTSLLVSLAVVVAGFALVTPSLNSLLSRRSDPAKQGSVLGVGQSIASLARILGPMAGVPLIKNQALATSLSLRPSALPLILGAGMMAVGLICILLAARGGKDYGAASPGVEVDVNPLG